MEEFKKLDRDKLPRHIGLILDGNRRWAKRHGNKRTEAGHLQGYKNITDVLPYFFEAGIRYLSIYALSLDNLKKRSDYELDYILNIISLAVDRVKEEPIVKDEKIKFNVIGRTSLLPQEVRDKINELTEYTKDHDGGYVNVCIVYDGQAEIVDAVKDIVKEGIKTEDVTEDLIREHLYDKGSFPPVDYIIRTGMEDGARISGFLLWDASYAEFKFREDLWPDYSKEMILEDLKDYIRRNRRMGK